VNRDRISGDCGWCGPDEKLDRQARDELKTSDRDSDRLLTLLGIASLDLAASPAIAFGHCRLGGFRRPVDAGRANGAVLAQVNRTASLNLPPQQTYDQNQRVP